MPSPPLLIAPRSAAALLMLALASVSPAQSRPTHDPERARLITEDIPRFWAAYDARATLGSASAFDSLYLRPGSRGLRDFTTLRITDATALTRTVASAERYYASIRASTERVATQDSTIRAAFRRLKALHPDAVFPDVYFVVGRMTSGGTTSDAGLLIGVEMYGRTTDSALTGLSAWHRDVLAPVERLPAIVAHELCHYQQTSRRNETLLARALREGMCDFVSELAAGAQINEVATAYGLANEHALWEE
ncbi:MAG: hypothetical protein K2X99_00305, partial [Gemmatimonadaceae bacterium]|nr:hypothetical protein [Gemmatimonadaceae bacterium]